MRVLSLGWGVQSFALAAMSALGEIERVDVALHADTTHERQATYHHAEEWTPWLEKHGIKVVTVKLDRPMKPESFYGRVAIPAYMTTEKGRGQFGRECTDNWKRRPMRQWLQQNRNGEVVELWLGISLDEALRMKPSNVKYTIHRWPLIEKHMARADCIRWLQSCGLEVPPKSACVFCPFHGIREWQELKRHDDDWRKAVKTDNAIRKARPPYDLFIHPARRPLEEVDLRTQEEKGQMRLDGWDAECSGLCGV